MSRALATSDSALDRKHASIPNRAITFSGTCFQWQVDDYAERTRLALRLRHSRWLTCEAGSLWRQTERVGDTAAAGDEVVLRRVRDICGRFEGVDEGELQDRPLFRVGRRRFAIFNGSTSPMRPRWDGSGRSLHFLADPAELEALRHDVRFVPSPHHGNRGWLTIRIDDVDTVDWTEIAELLESAHQVVAPSRS